MKFAGKMREISLEALSITKRPPKNAGLEIVGGRINVSS